jgi:hypothetical protein
LAATRHDCPDLDTAEDVRRVFVELILHGLAGVGGDRRDIDESGDAIVHARAGDCGAAVGMADEDHGAANTVERARHGREIFCVAVEPVLHGDHLIAICLQRGDHLGEARAVSPKSVAENDGRPFCRHIALLCLREMEMKF